MAPVRRKGGGGGGDGAKRSGGGGGGGKSFWGKGGLEGEVSKNLVDIVCTWAMLAGMVCSALWVDWAVPTFCAKADASEKVCTEFRTCCCCRRRRCSRQGWACPRASMRGPPPHDVSFLALSCTSPWADFDV